MELVSSNSETVPRNAISKYRFKRYNFKTEQIIFKLNSEASIIFRIINTNFLSLHIIFNQLKTEDSNFYPDLIIKFKNLIVKFILIFEFQIKLSFEYLNSIKYSHFKCQKFRVVTIFPP